MSKFAISCTAFQPHRRNTLHGFATIHLSALRLTIKDVAIHQHVNGATWAQLPSKPQIDSSGVVHRNAAGKIQYNAIMEFGDAGTRNAFSQAVVRAVLEHRPDALDTTAAALS